MQISLLIVMLLAPYCAYGQTDTTTFTDTATGITFQTSEHGSGMKFGIALPITPGNDFIGFFNGSVKDVSWAGADIGGSIMLGNLLVTAWPYTTAAGNSTIPGNATEAAPVPAKCKIPLGDVRLATGYATSEVKMYSGVGAVKVLSKPISKGVFQKGDIWQYTFLCQNCMANSTIALDQKEETMQLAYVVGSQPPEGHYQGAPLTEHTDRAVLYFSPNITAAKSDKFAQWAKLAEAPPNCAPKS
ncbi:hypothetical protein EJ08DRAFT_652212 [Tothia fuscella]|uniref:Cellobiose dehydrogenase-like cytochrome domain-containing protein n=1 Tax=Tothia fuscella TaxID=1048955 RepID=A0A9P4NK80_9PEZI|nr:hypothetical protein EJ08DRAFT_652212 [Tothia fuscella]